LTNIEYASQILPGAVHRKINFPEGGAFTSGFRERGRAMTPMTSRLVLTKQPTHASLAADNGWRTPLSIETYCDVRVLNFELNINNQ
jgi:hypothetical protein